MRIFASKRVGSVRIGVSGDVGGKRTKRTKPDGRLQAALAEQEQAAAELERSVATVGQNTTECAHKIADLDVALRHIRAGRGQMVAEMPKLAPDRRVHGIAMLAEIEANIAKMEASRAGLVTLMHTSAANHAAGLRKLAECNAARDAALKRL